MQDINALYELYGIANIIDPEDIYIVIADDFSYETASRDDVIFYDRVAEYEHGWERHNLDSLASDEISQLPYEPGFGSIKIPDDNGSSTYTTLNDFRGADLESDWEIDNFDDDPNWDYVWDFYDETTNDWVSYFTNDIDGIDNVPFLQEGLDQGMYLSNFFRFEDLDGDVDYYDINDTDDYYKVDIDPIWDYSFHNWEEDAQIIEGTEDFKYLSKGEIELRKNDENFSTTQHGDEVFRNFINELNPEYLDKIKIIAIDLWDKLEDETLWFEDVTSVFNVFTDAYTRFNIELDNIIVASESFNTTSSDIISSNNYFIENGIFVTNSLPNDGKYANRYWDAYLEDIILAQEDVFHVSGMESGLEGYPNSLPYSTIAASAESTGTTDWVGTSFATPKVAADITNLKLDLDQEGISFEELSTENIIELISVDGISQYSSLSEVNPETLESVLGFNPFYTNENPTITSSDSSTVLENASTDTVYDAEANDPDNDTLTYSLSQAAMHLMSQSIVMMER